MATARNAWRQAHRTISPSQSTPSSSCRRCACGCTVEMPRGDGKMSPHEPVNILLVDDQPAKLLSYEVILSELGENLVKAASASEALALLLKNDFEVVLMDVSMP